MDAQWLYPLLVAAFLAVFGWLLRAFVSNLSDDLTEVHRKMDEIGKSVDDKIDTLDASFSRATAQLANDHNLLRREIDKHDRRLIRLESWKELLSLPDADGRRRRAVDQIMEDSDNG